MTNVKITPTDHGPYQVDGPVTVIDAAGTEYDIPEQTTIYLCRCGNSATNRSATEPTKHCPSRPPTEQQACPPPSSALLLRTNQHSARANRTSCLDRQREADGRLDAAAWSARGFDQAHE
jgi:hypothetical protein